VNSLAKIVGLLVFLVEGGVEGEGARGEVELADEGGLGLPLPSNRAALEQVARVALATLG